MRYVLKAMRIRTTETYTYSNITDLEGVGKQEAVPRKTTFIFLAPVLGDCGHRITFSSTIGF